MVTTKDYTFDTVTANHTLSAGFTKMVTVNIAAHNTNATHCKIKYAISDTATAPSTGWTDINPPTTTGLNISVPSGKYLHFEAYEINPGYSFWKWGIVDQPGNPETDDNDNPSAVYADTHDIEVYLYLNTVATHNISVTCGTGGTITYTTTYGASGTITAGQTSSVVVIEGYSITFTVTANSGYEINSILVDGSPITLE